VGAGDAAQLAVLMVRNNPAGRAFHVVGVVDDDLDLLGTSLHGVPVLGVCERIPQIARERGIDTILFAIHNIEDRRRDASEAKRLDGMGGTGADRIDGMARSTAPAPSPASSGWRSR